MTNTTCPVCNTPCQPAATSCPTCGFEDQHGIARPIVTQEEANHRLETVIRPYRRQWEAFCKKEEALQAARERISRYQGCIATGYYCVAGLKTDGTVVATGVAGSYNTQPWQDVVAVAAGTDTVVGLKSDGTVDNVGPSRTASFITDDWHNITSITAAQDHVVGLKSDGTVVIAGSQRDTSHWCDIAAIAVDGHSFHRTHLESLTVGIKSDGTIVAASPAIHIVNGPLNQIGVLSDWRDITAIAASPLWHVVGLKSDGTVVAAVWDQVSRMFLPCYENNWQDIVSIATSSQHLVGLKADGTVVSSGVNKHGQCDTGSWRDIVAIAAGRKYTMGLKLDGTVVVAGSIKNNFLFPGTKISNWNSIVAIAGSEYRVVGLRADGTVVVAGNTIENHYDTSGWRNIGPAS